MISAKGRGLILLLFFLALVSVVAERLLPGQRDKVMWQSIAAGQAKARESGRPILYDFTAEWCPPCRMLKKRVFSDEATADRINQQFVPIQVLDRQKEEGKNPADVDELEAHYGVEAFPTIVAAAPDGDPYSIFVGYKDKEYVAQFLDRVLKKHADAGKAAGSPP